MVLFPEKLHALLELTHLKQQSEELMCVKVILSQIIEALPILVGQNV
jgi:hypothetical protein